MWKAKIDLGVAALKDYIEEGQRFEKSYEGKILSNSSSNDVQVNFFYVDMKQSIPSYYSKNPKIFFTPKRPGAEKSAQVKELLVNQKWNERKMKGLMRESIKLTKLYGMCGFKTYFYFNRDSKKDEWNGRIENDDVRTDVVSLKNLIKDPDASSWNSSPWIGHRVDEKRSEIAKKFKIPLKDRHRIMEVSSTTGSKDLSVDAGVKEEFSYGRYWEIEDRVNRRTFVYIEGLDKIYDEKDRSDELYDTMWDFLSYNDIPGLQPYSDFHFWESQAKEASKYRSMMARHASKGVSKYFSKGTKLTQTQKQQLFSSQVTSLVELDQNQIIDSLQHAQLDPQIVACYSMATQDIQLISKQAPRQSVGDDKTATEVKAIEMAAREVSSENLDRLEEVMANIANKWAMLMEKYYTTTRVISLAEVGEAEFLNYQNSFSDKIQGSKNNLFLTISNEDLKGEVQASVKAGSTQPDSDQARMAKLMNFSKFVAQIPGAVQAIDLEELIDEAVDVFDVRNDNLTRRKDNPAGESRLLNSGVVISAKLSEDHDKHLAIHEAESNGNNQNISHILQHKLFKEMLEQNKIAAAKSAISKLEDSGPLSGQSFVGANQSQPPSLLTTTPAQANGSQVPNQGVPTL